MSAPRAAAVALALLHGSANATDPWGRPEHLRAVAEPPATVHGIGAERARVRLWWDEVCPWATDTALDLAHCRTAEVQVLARRWRTVERSATPGWTSQPVPPETRFRVHVDGAARWSEVVSAPDVVTPTDLAALAGPGLLAAEVGQLAVLGRDSVVASTLGGGLLSAGPAGLQQRWTRWDGLPDDRVIAVDARGDAILAGSGRGAVLVQQGRVVAVYDDLPSSYVQATHIGEHALWLGTDAGLAQVRRGVVEMVSTNAAVYSVSPARGGGVWVGAGGLWKLDEDGAAGDLLLVGEHVYDVLDHGAPTWVATTESGLLALDGTTIRAERDLAEATAIAPGPGGPWVATGTGGVSGPTETLDVGTAWSVATIAGRLWIGTDHGLVWREGEDSGALPLTAWPAEAMVSQLSSCDDGVSALLAEGPVSLGAPCPADEHLAGRDNAYRLAKARFQHLDDAAWTDGTLWVIARGSVFEMTSGRVEPHISTRAPLSLGVDANGVCIGTVHGVERLDGWTLDLGEAVPAVAPDGDGCWYATASGLVGRTSGGSQRLPTSSEPAVHHLAPDSADPDAIWVLSDRGAWRVVVPR